ncbi:flagellar hook-length control protein FliK [Pseudoalteromonas aliena]|uniref:flagellar hook-length control protein FliK n=1 Tax=Pseudoalteromonas aliena TaxID=247523 RepID=UPI0024959F54|nr:flagellar hook-length control protein FliK [Pseudoalteromonas aliena]
MNTPTQITLSNSLVINQSSNAQTNELSQLPDEVLAAKNIQFSKDSITLDVFIDKHWQTLRLGTTNVPQNLQKIASANIQLSPDGKQLNITPNSTTLTINQPAQLQRLLNYVSTGAEVESKPMAVQVVLSPTPKLVIDKLNASIAINKEVAQLLITEQPLKVIVSTNNKGAQLNVINSFADTVHSQPLSQARLTKLLAALLPNAQLQATPKLAILTHPQKSGSFTTPINNKQVSELPNIPIKVNLVNQADKLFIKTDTNNINVTLNNSFSKPFNELLLAQKNSDPEISISTSSNSKMSPLLTQSSPIKSWLLHSFSDLKTRINDAVKYFEHKPFATGSKQTIALAPELSKSDTPSAVINQQLKKINMTQNLDMLIKGTDGKTLINATNILPKHFNQLPPLAQLTQLLKASVNIWQALPQHNQTLPASNANNNDAHHFKNIISPESISRSQMLQPIEAKLLSPLLKLPDSIAATEKPVNSKSILNSQINNITSKIEKDSPDLTRLINQAFNRMVSSTNVHPVTIQREILTNIQPSILANDTLQSSFTKGLEQMAVSILAAPAINQSIIPVSLNNHTGIDALLQVLLPTFKTGNTSAKLLEQLQQPQVQALANELIQVKNTLNQVQVSMPNQHPDSNPLVQFLLPMKLPPEAAQTEITLGQYKKLSSDKLESKNVWFVRLNFDYAELGQLQITAELMDKALDCQLLASSQEITAIAHPHLDNLRSKLAKHGLQVGELNLKRGDTNHQAFDNSHAIINIKV